jgi:hypothetical protein
VAGLVQLLSESALSSHYHSHPHARSGSPSGRSSRKGYLLTCSGGVDCVLGQFREQVVSILLLNCSLLNQPLTDITTERELYAWLFEYMQTGEKVSYPKPVVQFAEKLLRAVPDGLDIETIGDTLQLKHSWTYTSLGALFMELGEDRSLVEYSDTFIETAGMIYECLCLDGRISLWAANRIMIRRFGLGFVHYPGDRHATYNYFAPLVKRGERFLVSTEDFEIGEAFRIGEDVKVRVSEGPVNRTRRCGPCARFLMREEMREER